MGVASAIAGAIGVGGALLGAKKQSDAISDAANTQAAASQQAQDTQMQMYNQSREDYQPYMDTGTGSLPLLNYLATGIEPEEWGGDLPELYPEQNYLQQIEGLSPATTEQNYLQQMEGVDPNISVDFENSPIYQAQKEELMRTLGNSFSARGLSKSSAAEDAILRNVVPLMQDEYGRNVDTYNRTTNKLNNLYGLTSDFNQRDYGNTYNRLAGLYQMSGATGDKQYGRALDLTKIGAGAASTAGQNALQTGTNLANMQINTGNNLANLQVAQGQNQANMWSNLGALPMQIYNTTQMTNALKSNPFSYSPYTGSTRMSTVPFN